MDEAPLRDVPVASLIPSLGDLADKTLEGLTGERLESSPNDTSLVRRCQAAWATPLRALTCEQLRLLIGQAMGLDWLAPIACEVALRHPGRQVSFHPGDLALALLRGFPDVLAADGNSARAFAALDHAWIEDQRALDAEYGTRTGAEAAELLASARALAAQ